MYIKIYLIFLSLIIQNVLAKDDKYIIQKLKYHNGAVLSVAFSQTGEMLLSGDADKKCILYNINNDETILYIEAHLDGVKTVKFSKNSDLFYTAGDKSIKIWNFEGIQQKIFLGSYTYIWSIDISSNEKYIVSGSYEKYPRIWDIEKVEMLTTLEGHEKSVLAVCISPDNKLIASGSLDKTIKLWDLNTYELIHTFEGHADNIMCLKFSKNGKYLLSASLDKNLKLWDVKNRVFVRNYIEHEKGVLTCDFSPDDKYIISGGYDNKIKLWETNTDACIYTYSSHEDVINDVCFSNDGKSFGSASNDETIILWELNEEIFVYYYFAEEFYNELESNEVWGPKKPGENKTDYNVRQIEAEKYKNQLINKYYNKYLSK